MEHNEIQWVGAPCFLRGSFAFYKSFSHRAEAGQRPRVWNLGQFYFVRCAPQEPVCIAELTLLFEDQVQRHLLAHSRLYFLPEDTPKGRTREHGEDEVLAFSKKIVVRLEDFIRWACPESPRWKRHSPEVRGRRETCEKKQMCGPGALGLAGEEAEEGRPATPRHSVKVLSYPQYCRFRSLQRRIQDVAGNRPLQDPHLLALGGLRQPQRNTWVLYCRDTFNHPGLENNTSVCTHLGFTSLSLKGRPRKRKNMDGRGLDYRSQPGSWMERMKENVMGSVDVQGESSWLPHPEEQHFLDQLYVFMERRGSPISKVPKLGFKKVDLFLLFSAVKKLGGYEVVTSQRLWKRVYDELGGNPGSTSAATCTRRHYEKLILPFERQMKGVTSKPTASQGPTVTSLGSHASPGRAAETRWRGKTCAVQQEADEKWGGKALTRRGRPRGRRQARSSARELPAKLTSQRESPSSLLWSPQCEKLPMALKTLHAGSLLPAEGLSSDDVKVSLQSMDEETQNLTPEKRVPTQALSNPRQPLVSPVSEKRVKVEPVGQPSPSSPPSFIQLHDNRSLVGSCPSKDLSSIDLLRTRLGLSSECPSGSDPLGPPVASQCCPQSLGLMDKAGENQNHLKWERCSGPTDGDSSFKCHVGCVSLDGLCKIHKPLKVLPLDINCSLQVHHLMRTPPGSSQLSSFGKKLSEALAQDLSLACQSGSPFPAFQEQTCPLNLSKRSTTKRPIGDPEPEVRDTCQCDGDLPSDVKRLKVKQEFAEDPSSVVEVSGHTELPQEEPTDLSIVRSCGRSSQEEGWVCGQSATEADAQHPLLAGVEVAHPSGSIVHSCSHSDQVKVETEAEQGRIGCGGCAPSGPQTRTMTRLKDQTVELGK